MFNVVNRLLEIKLTSRILQTLMTHYDAVFAAHVVSASEATPIVRAFVQVDAVVAAMRSKGTYTCGYGNCATVGSDDTLIKHAMRQHSNVGSLTLLGAAPTSKNRRFSIRCEQFE